MVKVKRIQGAREAILTYLKNPKGVERSQGSIYAYMDTQGFPNVNTVRGRLSELFTDGVITRRKGGYGLVWYRVPNYVGANDIGDETGGY